MKKKILVTVSGGKSSAYMAIRMNEENKKKPEYLKRDLIFVYANTGQEHTETIKFLKNIFENFGILIHLLEADVKDGRVGTKYREVTWDTISTDGEPFEDVISKYGLPNNNYLHCTRELKISPMNAYMKDHGITERALGIRYDEPNRIRKQKGVYYPLNDWKITKKDINKWWEDQSFNLDIPDYLGNCLTCHKKSDRKLNIIAKEHPEYFDFYKSMEEKYPDDTRQIFRGYRNTQDILDGVEYDLFDDICAEECGSILV